MAIRPNVTCKLLLQIVKGVFTIVFFRTSTTEREAADKYWFGDMQKNVTDTRKKVNTCCKALPFKLSWY